MNKGFGFLLLLLVTLISCTNKTTDKTASANHDSIQKYLTLAGNDTLAFEKRIKYNDKALGLVDLEENDSLTREYLNLVVYNYLTAKDWQKYKKYSHYYFEKTTKEKDTLGLARYYRYKGGYFRTVKIYDSAFYQYSKSEKLYKKTRDKVGLARVYLSKSSVQNELNDFLGAELSAKKAYSYFKETKCHYDYYISAVILGNIYQDLKEYDKAILMLEEAMMIVEKHNIPDKKMNLLKNLCLNNIGNAYREQKKYKKAITYFKLALKEKNIIKRDPLLYGNIINNLGYCYLKTNRKNYLPYYFYKSKSIFDSLGIKDESTISDIYLSEFYIKKGETLKANLHADQALRSAREANASHYYLSALKNASDINPKKAQNYFDEFYEKNDSILFAERIARNQYHKIQLETAEITLQKDIALKQRLIVIIIALTLFFIAILIFIIAHQRLKQKELRLKETEQKANENIYQLMLTQEGKEEKVRQIEKKRIGLELHDGIMNKLVSTRLNLSILTINRDEATIKKCLDYIKDIQTIEKEIRNLAHDLNQKISFDSNSFSKLFSDFIKEHNRTSSTCFRMEIDPAIDWNIVSNSSKMNLYRVIQEASQNIIKHANAKNAKITILLNGDKLSLSITDDGIGLNPSASENGIGLKNMKYRIKLLKGKFKINSKPNSGTSIIVTIPLTDID